MFRVTCGGEVHEFKTLPITVGRDDDNDLAVDDVKLSRQHCRFVRTSEGITIEDMESSNGTYVNGVPTRRHVLAAGDTVLIGATPLDIGWDNELAPAPKPRKSNPAETAAVKRENIRFRQLLLLAKAVSHERNEEILLRNILDSAIQLTGAERGMLFLITLHGLDFKCSRDNKGDDLELPDKHISHSIASEAVETGRPVITEDAAGDTRFAGRSVAFLKLRSVLCVPLKVPDGPLGALYLENRHATSQFDPRDIPVVTAFGDYASIALAAARKVEDLRQREEQLQRSRERIGRLNGRLKAMLRKQSMELASGRTDLDRIRQEGCSFDYSSIVGQSEAMLNVLALLDRIIETDIPVLVTGESGTGKELVARAIHFNGGRRESRLVAVKCAAIPGDLIETALFGREVGADTAQPGFFERADRGTLFLDEIADIPVEVQSKLLRVLETGEVQRVGGTEVRKVEFRTIAASNRDLKEMVEIGQMREDLYYRLAGVVCVLPPLRERHEDIVLLFDHFVDALCAEQEIDRPPVDPEVLDYLQAYPWPGNVRELHNEVQRILAIQQGRISPEVLSLSVLSGDPSTVPPTNLPPGGLKELVANLERRVILDTLRRVNGNKTRTASLLGLSRPGLHKKMRRFGLSA